MELKSLRTLLEKRLDAELRPKRALHSRSVAALASQLCERNGFDPLRGLIAGLAHDLCKEMKLERQEELAGHWERKSGRKVEREGNFWAKVVHGPAAAGLLSLEYEVADFDILEAVALHTLGGADMSGLAQIVYAADKLEPGREHVERVFFERCLSLPPPALFQAVLGETIEWLRSRGLPIAEESLALYDPSALREGDA